MDGNEAVASVAYRLNEIIAIYPITPASVMGELSDEWAAAGGRHAFACIAQAATRPRTAPAAAPAAVCPVNDKCHPGHKALDMTPERPLREREADNDRFGVPAVEFEDVWLSFDENPVLRGLSFTVRAGEMILVTHQLQDAFYVATHEAVRRNGTFEICPADPQKREEAVFIMLRDGQVYFEGHAEAFRRSPDPYLRTFLTGWVPPLV